MIGCMGFGGVGIEFRLEGVQYRCMLSHTNPKGPCRQCPKCINIGPEVHI